MRSIRRIVSIAVVCAASLTAAPAAAAAEPPHLRVAVALDTATAPPPRQTAAMIAEADAIWQPHGVSVALSETTAPNSGTIRLALTFDSGQVGRQSPAGPGRAAVGTGHGLGAIAFDENGAPHDAVVVNAAAIGLRIRQAKVSGRDLDAWPPSLADFITGRALGRVLAHEIGHYLLAWPAHTGLGLMRAAFDGRELAGWDRRSFALDKQLLLRLGVRLARLESAERPLVATK